MVNVYIDGSAGTTGLRIYDRLRARSDVQLFTLPEELRKDPAARKEALNSCDIAFLCLPDAAAREAVSWVENPKTVVIDTSTAHRTHPDWAYGFAELSPAHREKIATSKRIAVPGCHATGFAALVYPLRARGIIPREMPLVCQSLTGYSGGGKPLIAAYQNPQRGKAYDAPRAYALQQQHKHLAEMTAVCDLASPPVFVPVLGDYYSGMLVSVPLSPRPRGGIVKVRAAYMEHYRGRPLIRVMSESNGEDNWIIAANTLAGYDNMRIFVTGNRNRVTVHAQLDNLGKGASGAAIACMNIALGLDEKTGLNILHRLRRPQERKIPVSPAKEGRNGPSGH